VLTIGGEVDSRAIAVATDCNVRIIIVIKITQEFLKMIIITIVIIIVIITIIIIIILVVTTKLTYE